MSLGQHLDELRSRLFKAAIAVVIGMVVAFVFYQEIWAFAVRPYRQAAELLGLPQDLRAFGPADGFVKTMWLCLIAGLSAVSPYVLWQLWGFVSAGLYVHEKRAVRIFFPISITLFALGAATAYVTIMPVGMQFLMAWNRRLGITTDFAVGPYVEMLTAFVFSLGLAFELPLVMLFLQAVGIIRRKTFVKGWRIAILVAFVIAMIVTPDPTPVSQVLMAVPLVGLYFLGVWGGQFVGEEKVRFTVWKAWPLVLTIGLMIALLFFSPYLAAWGARLWR